MMEICGVRGEQLPELFESYEVVGTLKPEVAEELGLGNLSKCIAGAGDNAAAAVGTGTVGDGQCNISLEPAERSLFPVKTFGVDPHNALHSFAHADGHYHLMGCMLSAASCNKWWMDTIIGTKEYKKSRKQLKSWEKIMCSFLPYLMGDDLRTMIRRQEATFIGMSMDTTRADMTQAVLEGVAFAIRDSFEIAKSLGIHIENQDLRRWSEESTVEKDHCQCTEYQSNGSLLRKRLPFWRCDACCSCGWNLCIGGRGGLQGS